MDYILDYFEDKSRIFILVYFIDASSCVFFIPINMLSSTFHYLAWTIPAVLCSLQTPCLFFLLHAVGYSGRELKKSFWGTCVCYATVGAMSGSRYGQYWCNERHENGDPYHIDGYSNVARSANASFLHVQGETIRLSYIHSYIHGPQND